MHSPSRTRSPSQHSPAASSSSPWAKNSVAATSRASEARTSREAVEEPARHRRRVVVRQGAAEPLRPQAPRARRAEQAGPAGAAAGSAQAGAQHGQIPREAERQAVCRQSAGRRGRVGQHRVHPGRRHWAAQRTHRHAEMQRRVEAKLRQRGQALPRAGAPQRSRCRVHPPARPFRQCRTPFRQAALAGVDLLPAPDQAHQNRAVLPPRHDVQQQGGLARLQPPGGLGDGVGGRPAALRLVDHHHALGRRAGGGVVGRGTAARPGLHLPCAAARRATRSRRRGPAPPAARAPARGCR